MQDLAPCIIIDAGTATTLNAWQPGPRFAGGLICPGAHACAYGLAHLAPALPLVDVPAPGAAAQHDTPEAIAQALAIGYPAMIAACLRQLHAECPVGRVVVSGGSAASLVPALRAVADELACEFREESDLTIRGLARLAQPDAAAGNVNP